MLIRIDYLSGYLASPKHHPMKRIIDLELYTRVIWVNCWLRTIMQVFRSFLWGVPRSEMSLLICCLESEDPCVLGASEVVRRL